MLKATHTIWKKTLGSLLLAGICLQLQAADTAPPTLDSFVSPDASGSQFAIYMPLYLVFNEDMAPQQSIAWSSNIDTSKVSYTWEDSTTLLVAYSSSIPGLSAWPDNSTITWQLNPTANSAANFRDVAGNYLASGTYSGTFITGTGGSTNNPGTNSPCETGAGQVSGFTVYKMVSYVQTAANSVTIDPQDGAMFGLGVIMPDTAGLTAAKLTLPNGTATNIAAIAAMPPFTTNAYATTYDTKATQALLDQAYPSGNYKVDINAALSGSASVSLTAYPPIPQIANYPQAQAIDPNADFTVQWNAFTGAGTYDGINISITDTNSGETVFSAPDECATPKIELAVTATSIKIPKGTLTAGKNYELRLSFYHTESYMVALTTGSYGNSALSKHTTMTIKTTGGTVTLAAPQFSQVRRSSAGVLEFQLSCMTQRSVVIESSVDLKEWSTVLTTNAPAANITVDLPAGPKSFFRARQL